MDFTRILTPKVKHSIKMSCDAAIFEGNDSVCIDTDRILSIFSETLTPNEYSKFSWNDAENFLFEYASNMFKKAEEIPASVKNG